MPIFKAVAHSLMFASPKMTWKRRYSTGICMWFVAGIHQRPLIHRIDTDQDGKKIGALRDLISPGLSSRALRFDSHLARAGENLPSNKKREDAADDPVPWHVAAHQVIVMATITMTRKVGVVLIKPHHLFVQATSDFAGARTPPEFVRRPCPAPPLRAKWCIPESNIPDARGHCKDAHRCSGRGRF